MNKTKEKNGIRSSKLLLSVVSKYRQKIVDGILINGPNADR